MGVVQNRRRICPIAVIQVLVESNRVIRCAAVQQISYFTAGELLSGSGKCTVTVVGFAVGKVVTVCECAAIVLTTYIADIRCACYFSCIVAVDIFAVIKAAYTADPTVACNIPCVIAIFNFAIILTDYAADIKTTLASYYTSHISCAIAITDRTSFIIGTANAANVIAAPKVGIF